MTTLKHGYHHGDLSAAVRQAAGKLLEKHGLEALTMRELARRAKVSHNAPYRHFPDRGALLAALAAEGFAVLGEAQRRAAETGGLRAMGEAYVRFALEHPQRFRLMFGGQIRFAKHARLREVAGGVFEDLAGALATRVPEARGARDASIAAWALVHGLALLLLEQRIAASARAGRDEATFVRAVLGSLRFAIGPAQPA
ncbi:MAG: TetR/AcrR family transcriptional regulator [Betaproteobacteria bacterium]|nr:TetR/AcrR family transcriptional regulator [Betaproteobacteria bacterium]